jgi:prepilin-type N-terminal cleavage/methylation domain-containing protein
MRRGFTIIEIIVALGLMLVGFFTFFSVFSTGSHHAIQTRNRAVANLMAQSYLEEFKAHTYGDPAPLLWSEEEDKPLRLVVRGREIQFKFHKEITFQNRSFVGESNENHDVVKIVITWRELVGDSQTEGLNDNKKLEAEVPVWR